MVLEELLSNVYLPYAAAFIVFFSVIIFAIKRTPFGENATISTIISVALSLLIVWGLVNYTDYLNFSFENLNLSFFGIVITIVAVLLIFLMIKSAWTGQRRYQIPGFMLSISGLLIVTGVLPFIFSVYFLPEWINSYHYLFLIAGIILGIYSITRIKPFQRSVLTH